MEFRKATEQDIPVVAALYERNHDAEEAGLAKTGWKRGVYPTEETAREALLRDDLYLGFDEEGAAVGSCVINHMQSDYYEGNDWEAEVAPEKVMVLHTLTVDPARRGEGIGDAFVDFFERTAKEAGCTCARLDTGVINPVSRPLYRKHGFREVGIVSITYMGIEDFGIVLFEKML